MLLPEPEPLSLLLCPITPTLSLPSTYLHLMPHLSFKIPVESHDSDLSPSALPPSLPPSLPLGLATCCKENFACVSLGCENRGSCLEFAHEESCLLMPESKLIPAIEWLNVANVIRTCIFKELL